MEYSNGDADRKRKIRIIATTCVVAVVVLGVAAFAIISAITGIGSGAQVTETANTTTVSKTESAATTKPTNNTKPTTEKAKTEEKAEAKTTEDSETASVANTASTSGASAKAAEQVPSTGPTEVAFSAVLMGVATYLVLLNRQLTSGGDLAHKTFPSD